MVKPTVDLINTNAEWLFAGFTYITGTGLNAECSRIAQLIRFMACALSSLFLILAVMAVWRSWQAVQVRDGRILIKISAG